MRKIDDMRKMNGYEFAVWYSQHIICERCEYNDNCPARYVRPMSLLIDTDKCVGHILEGLLRESNPMPEIQTGDVVVYKGDIKEMELFCVSNDKAYLLQDDMCFTITDDFKKRFKLIARYNSQLGRVENIWRRDNE